MPECEFLPEVGEVVGHIDDEHALLAPIEWPTEPTTDHLLIDVRAEGRACNEHGVHLRDVEALGEDVVVREHPHSLGLEVLDVPAPGVWIGCSRDGPGFYPVVRQQGGENLGVLDRRREQECCLVLRKFEDRVHDLGVACVVLAQTALDRFRKTAHLRRPPDLLLAELQIGAAQFSTVHANFIVNQGSATAADVLALIDLARGSAWDALSVELTPEIMFLGDWSVQPPYQPLVERTS